MIWNKAPRKQEGLAIAAEAAVAITIQRVVSSKHTSSTLRAVFWQTKGGQGLCWVFVDAIHTRQSSKPNWTFDSRILIVPEQSSSLLLPRCGGEEN
jgi:hypothetical protein